MAETDRLLIDVRSSRLLILSLCFLHGMALMSVFLVIDDVSSAVIIALVIFLVTSLVFTLNNTCRRKFISLAIDDECLIIVTGDRTEKARLLKKAYSSDWLTILVFKMLDTNKNSYTILAHDSISPSGLKKLKSLLKISLLANADNGGSL